MPLFQKLLFDFDCYSCCSVVIWVFSNFATSTTKSLQKNWQDDKLSCDSSTGGWWENDMMMDRLGSPAGFIEVMFRMHIL